MGELRCARLVRMALAVSKNFKIEIGDFKYSESKKATTNEIDSSWLPGYS
jgi:hypothetical protein